MLSRISRRQKTSPELEDGSPHIEQTLRAEVDCARKQVKIARTVSAAAHTARCGQLLRALERLNWFLIIGSIADNL